MLKNEFTIYDSSTIPIASDAIRFAFVQPKIPDGNYLPNLGIMTLSALLIKNGYHVKIFDENLSTDIKKEICAFDPFAIGLTCVTAALHSASTICQELKKQKPNIVTIVGGPHLSALPKETITNHKEFDYGIQGEAEKSLLTLLKSLISNDKLYHLIPGLVYRTEKQNVISNRAEQFLENKELDELPFPAWHLLPMEEIFSKVTHGLFSRGKRIMPIMTSRGCPNYCGFCCRVMGFKFRTMSLDRILLEIQWLFDKFQIDEVYFEDDTFTQDPTRAHEILDGLIALKLPLKVKFANGLRADKVDRELLIKMKQAGVYWVGFGIESGSHHTQKLMRKFLDLNLAAKNVQLAKSLGFKTGSNCIIGYPGETKESIRESVNYFFKLPLDSFAVVTCVPFPGTTAWQECVKNNWLTERAKEYKNYWFEIFKVSPLIETPYLSSKELTKEIQWVYIRFYFFSFKRLFLVSTMILRKFFSKTPPIQRFVRILRANLLLGSNKHEI
ncbi:MAG: B12-binding domain-containing radical SAM protein [Oligoflexia bacterium]|nr:B12-binding domain-containing radical SAM protein [Oligoflexia bacterium]